MASNSIVKFGNQSINLPGSLAKSDRFQQTHKLRLKRKWELTIKW